MTTQEKNGITEGVIWKQLLIFFFPILVGSFFQQLYNTVDSVIVGQFVGKEALSSVGGSAGQIISLVVGFFTGVSTGATVILFTPLTHLHLWEDLCSELPGSFLHHRCCSG